MVRLIGQPHMVLDEKVSRSWGLRLAFGREHVLIGWGGSDGHSVLKRKEA